MQCFRCKNPESHVLRTAYDDIKNIIHRRRECLKCKARFSTSEKVRENQPQYNRFVLSTGK